MANGYRLKASIILLVSVFLILLYIVRLFIVKEGYTSVSSASPTPSSSSSSTPVNSSNSTQLSAVPGSAFNIQCPNSAVPTITYGTAGSGLDSGISGNPGSTPQTGIPRSTPASTSSSDPLQNTSNPYTTSLKPTMAQCQQYYTFDGEVN
jgi:hypothetical protein